MEINIHKFEAEEVKHKKEIQDFLEKNEIKYSTDLGNFCLYYGNPDGKRSYEIEYVSSVKYPIAYPKFDMEGVDAKYFYNLSRQAEDNNSFKLWVKDFEWRDERKREVLKSYILHAAGKTKYKWYARDCVVKEVPPNIGGEFELENCFYGKRGASLRLGLYSKKEKNNVPADTLLMLYTFGANFFAKNETVIEVIRVGTRRFSQVLGGSSKLFKHFLRNYKTIHVGKRDLTVDLVKFYSDYDHNIGNSMHHLGFESIGYSTGGFMNLWLELGEFGTIKHRSPMHHKMIMEKMAEGKILSIPNAGVKTFVIRRSKILDTL